MVIYIAHFITYTYTFISNPGLMKKSDSVSMKETDDKKIGYRFCNSCRILLKLTTKTNHCDDCNICVEGIIAIK